MTLQSDLNPVRFGFELAAQRNIDLGTLLSRLEVLRVVPPEPRGQRTVPGDVERLTPTIVDAAAGLCSLSEALANPAEPGEVPAGWPARVPASSAADAATALALAASLLDLIIEDCLEHHERLAPGIPQRLRNGRRLLRDGVLTDLEAVLDADTVAVAPAPGAAD
ncbi:MAG: hypothetical protein R2755_19950 [Acidimicrobiales bacterium]